MKKQDPTVHARTARSGSTLAAVGLESEFVCVVGERAVDPRDVFGDPRAFLGDNAPHRTGSSYHLPNGGAVYFDTGVIEIVTPVVELGRACAAQVTHSLWEGVGAVRERLDQWGQREGQEARLVGFSTHYNVSLPELADPGRMLRASRVLADLLPFPVMLFAANRRSTGVGVRPRTRRVEVTVDFTPDSMLMLATGALISAAVMEVAGWDRPERADLERRGYPVIAGYEPVPHTSRKGWLARFSCFDPDPFRSPPNEALWRTTTGERVSVRGAARRVVSRLLPRVRELTTTRTRRFMEGVLLGRLPSLLDLEDRPSSYEDVGHLCGWHEPDPAHPVTRSRYEQVMLDAVSGRPVDVDGVAYRPVATRGWTRFRCRSDGGGTRTFSLEELARLRG
ncbi:MAG TPA: hypothetical protein VK966_11490 [Longimicrobiales bacterium]|nr:hypothetical protein [Longimicrobiales bacterium]